MVDNTQSSPSGSISGCGVCYNCRMGYAIACTSKNRQAYGWQRNGGIAPYILCDEKDLIALPDGLTYKDGASVSCGFGTVYEAIEKIGVSGDDAVLVVGFGPVGMAALMLCRAMGAEKLIGVEMNEYRIKMVQDMGLVDHIVRPSDNAVEEIRALTGGHGVERAIDCSASDAGRQTAIRATRDWGRVVLVSEGNSLTINPSPDMMHAQKTVYGSWVTSTWRMMELVEHLVRWSIHPGDLITDEFPLERADEAHALMASGKCGNVAVVFPEEE